jgi:hypothetical protein
MTSTPGAKAFIGVSQGTNGRRGREIKENYKEEGTSI